MTYGAQRKGDQGGLVQGSVHNPGCSHLPTEITFYLMFFLDSIQNNLSF